MKRHGAKDLGAKDLASMDLDGLVRGISVETQSRRVRSKKIHTLAVLISEDLERDENPINPFFLPLIGQILKYAGSQGYEVLTSLQQSSDDWGTDYGFSRRADGVIFLGCKDYDIYTHKFEYLNEVGDPWVVWGVDRPDCAKLCIASDNEGGAYNAVNHLIGLGRRRIAYLGKSSPDHPEFKERFDGYRRALAAAGIAFDPALVGDCFLRREEAQVCVGAMMAGGVAFDAIFCATDLLAMGAMQQVVRAGLVVPRDVSIIGFDDIWVCSSLSPSLTTVHQDTAAAARALVDGLGGLIEDEPFQITRIPTKLVVRESCGGLDP